MSIQEIKGKLSSEFIEMLEEVYTQSEIVSILKSYERGRYTSFRVNQINGQVSKVLKELRDNRIKAVDFSKIPNAFYIKEKIEGDLKKLDCYKNGEIYMQNLSSMFPALSIINENCTSFIDLCAAPGGKSLYLASLLNNCCEIIANEPNDIRREVLKYNIKKQGATSISVTSYDGKFILKNIDKFFDCAIVDVPCSGEGTLKLKKDGPNINFNLKKVRNFSKLQKKILKNAVELVRPSGVIIYSTCTLNPFENEFVVNEILKEGRVRIESVNYNIKGVKEGIIKYKEYTFSNELKNAIRIVPSEYMEGFFIAKLRKIK